jgi:hypothetical protein
VDSFYRLYSIALRVAGYDFKAKMKINALVIQEIARVSGVEDMNAIAGLIAESPIHDGIQALADSITEEAEKIKQKMVA